MNAITPLGSRDEIEMSIGVDVRGRQPLWQGVAFDMPLEGKSALSVAGKDSQSIEAGDVDSEIQFPILIEITHGNCIRKRKVASPVISQSRSAKGCAESASQKQGA